jgi:hypothetical protein
MINRLRETRTTVQYKLRISGTWSRPRRRLSTLAYLSPIIFEQTHAREAIAQCPKRDDRHEGAISVSPSGWHTGHPESRSLHQTGATPSTESKSERWGPLLVLLPFFL